MSDTMKVEAFAKLVERTLLEYEHNETIFGIHRSLFYVPRGDNAYATEMFGQYLATPIGPAAGPHTQLARNIISAWLSGGRFIELKTVQILDRLEIPRPCIDVADEGYNVEWSQELRLAESAQEYINAWVMIHILRRVLGFEGNAPFGTIFNMSVGYNLEGIRKPPMVEFMDTLMNASTAISRIKQTLAERWPEFADIDIPSQLTDSVTLSTMHGCPPDEIEQIARYLIEERGLHTIVKLNPTLLGKDEVLRILHDALGFREIDIPDSVFAHDLGYDRALQLIANLKESAASRGLFFGVKLSNTLAVSNHRHALPGDEMYMSGRALYPLTINLFEKLLRAFDGDLNVSYAGGADATNVVDILSAGACPVTAASDLLKPGGYSRLLQYVDNIEAAMLKRGADTFADLSRDRMSSLAKTAKAAIVDRRYRKEYHPYGLPKVSSALQTVDCITAPCTDACPVSQDVADYAWLIAHGEYDRALATVVARNPLPGITGYICTHVCQEKCTRNNYDEPVAIRALKRFAAENGNATQIAPADREHRVAIIGGGPSGLAAAAALALRGVDVTVYESKEVPGGMAAIAPRFRLPQRVVDEDIERIRKLGVTFELGGTVGSPPEELLKRGFEAVYIATGFQEDARLDIDGIDAVGVGADRVFFALDLLARAKRGDAIDLGSKVLVIGGGNTAMDAARTAARIASAPVTVVYRRTRAEMPAACEEVDELLIEGNSIMELVSPKRILRTEDGRVKSLVCVRNRLTEPGADGRRRPMPIEGSEFEIAADSIIVAIGQQPDITFLDGSGISVADKGTITVDPRTGATESACIYAGGDATRGPATIIQGCADGQRAAGAICAQLGIANLIPEVAHPVLSEDDIVEAKRARARREPMAQPRMLAASGRDGFDLVEQTLSEEQAQREGTRCLQCSTVCDKCVEVCPNRANYTYAIAPLHAKLPVLACHDGRLATVREEEFVLKQTRQIVHVDDFCNECGTCATFCVHEGRPYVDKPRLFLNEADFVNEDDNAYYVTRREIRHRLAGSEATLTQAENRLEYEDDHVRVTLSANLSIDNIRMKKAFAGELSLIHIAMMDVVLRGVQETLSFLID